MLPTVVTPPAMAAREPLSKSSAQPGTPGCGGPPGDRCTCMSMAPGSTSAPEASISRRPRSAPPSCTTFPPAIPTSAAPDPPAVTTVPPRTTRSHSP